jgi:glutathione synthase/RimK-type ligase-like ATP-grasp enzyme
MILILTQDAYEQGTEPVIDWLLHYNANFLRLTLNDLIREKEAIVADIANEKVTVKGVNLSQAVNVVFYRHFGDPITLFSKDSLSSREQQAIAETRNEARIFTDYLFHILRGKKWLPDYRNAEVYSNKLVAYAIARECGLRTPASFVANRKALLQQAHESCGGDVITKPIDYCGYYINDGHAYTAFTSPLTGEDINSLPNEFFPALIQEKVKRRYEVRVFYLEPDFYATAIINEQRAGQETADIKLLFEENHTHFVPYQLPQKVQQQLRRLMKRTGLTTSSLDLIRNENGDYIFIDINPAGQYLAPSERCNYYLEAQLAAYLIKHDKP